MAELPLISYKLFFEDLPDHLVTTFKAFKPEDQEKLRDMIKATEEQANLVIRAKMKKSVIFKLDQNYSLDTARNLITFELPAGKVVAPLTDELLEIISKANGSTYVKAKLSGVKPSRKRVITEAEKLQFFKADYNEEKSKELLKEHRAIDLLMFSLGYKPTAEAIAITLPRLLTLFKLEVELKGKVEKTNLRNSGRLPELLKPGNKVLLKEKVGGKTSYIVYVLFDGKVPVLVVSSLLNPLAEKILVKEGY